MSWLSKTKLVQDFVSVKRPLDFVPHGSVVVLDSQMNGTSRLCKQFTGEYTVLASDTLDTLSKQINAGAVMLVVDGWVKLPLNALLSIDTDEFVQSTGVDYVRDQANPTRKLTNIYLSKPIQQSYVSGTKLFLVGIPLQLLGPCQAGASSFMFETTEIAVSGDFVASFHYADSVPVLDAWQKIKLVQDKYEYTNSDGLLIRRYYCALSAPLLKTIDPDSYLYLKALPAYESITFPVELSGSYHVDAFTGKTFGKGSDDLTLTLSLFDANKTLISTDTYAKNDVLVVSSFPASDFVTWNVGAGTVSVNGLATSLFTLDAFGLFRIGNVFLKQPFSSCIALTLPTTLSSSVYWDVAVAASSYCIKVNTLSGTTMYVYDTAALELVVVAPDGVTTTYSGIPNTLYLDIQDRTNLMSLEVSGPAGVQLNCQTHDVGSIVTPYSAVVGAVAHVPVRYLSYTYRADMNIQDTWEGSCLMLKSSFHKLDDLYTDIDNLVPDSGQVFQ